MRLIASPVTPRRFGFGEKAADPVAMYLADLYTVPGSLAGIPTMSIPAALARARKTASAVGLQLMATT